MLNRKISNIALKNALLLFMLLALNVYATTFTCADLDTAACKTKLSKEFGAEFKNLHLTKIRELFTTFIDITEKMKDELPKENDLVSILQEANFKMSKHLETLNENTENVQTISDTINAGMKTLGIHAENNRKEFEELSEKHKLDDSLTDVMHELAIDIGNLWKVFGDALRPEDIKAYPAYADVNLLMEKLRRADSNSDKLIAYSDAADILANQFDIEYFKHINYLA